MTTNFSNRNDEAALGELTWALGLDPAVANPARRQIRALVIMRVLPVGIAVSQLRRDVLQGAVSVEQLLDLVETQQQTIQRLRRDNQRLLERLAQYEPEVRSIGLDT
jgi:hypothetical protein